MGDRCYLVLHFKKVDLDVVESTLYLDRCETRQSESHSGEVLMAEIEEANYGLWGELNKLAVKNITFWGWHSDGGSYPAQRFASHGERFSSVVDSHDGVCVYVEFNKEGKVFIPDGETKNAERYHEIVTAACNELEGVE